MEPEPTTPPDRSQRGSPPRTRPRPLEFEDDPLAGSAAGDEGPGASEDWRARYGAPPPPPPPRSGPDLSALFILLDGLRRAAPAEMQERLTSLIREALLTVRSLIDWYLERLDRRPAEREVEDIPID